MVDVAKPGGDLLKACLSWATWISPEMKRGGFVCTLSFILYDMRTRLHSVASCILDGRCCSCCYLLGT